MKTYTIKPFKWMGYYVQTPLGEIGVAKIGSVLDHWSFWVGEYRTGGTYRSCSEAKRAARAWYRRKMMSAFEEPMP